MQHILELSPTIQARRRELGLTQAALAQLSGLSRATVNALEAGTIGDLSVGRLSRVLGLLGLRLGLQAPARVASRSKQADRALQTAAQTASVSYATALPPAVLKAALASGELPAGYRAHMATLLDEAPLSVVVAAVGAAAQLSGVDASRIWRHVKAWARELRSVRVQWQDL